MEQCYVSHQLHEGITKDAIADEMAKMFFYVSLHDAMEIMLLASQKILDNNKNFREPDYIEELRKRELDLWGDLM